jgi:hypothetical protein
VTLGSRLSYLPAIALAIAWAGASPFAAAAPLSFTPPAEDRWMYPFNGTPGLRDTAPTFGAVSSYPTFDNRDGQFLMQFDTGAAIPSGLGASNYVITLATLEITVAGGSFQYDPSYDSYTTYNGGADGDAGRPVEVFGAGYRGGFDTLSFLENSPFGGPGAGNRNAYANDYAGGADRDVSNNVSLAFEAAPFGIGTAPLAPGDFVPAGTTMLVDLLLTPDAVSYLQNRLDLGAVDLVVATLHDAVFGGSPTYPIWATRENGSFAAPRLTLDVTVVPEPGTIALAMAGLLGLGVHGRRRR